jgi:hypothetical protein
VALIEEKYKQKAIDIKKEQDLKKKRKWNQFTQS